jgi:CheY-like chemotaxis protein
MRSVAGHLGDSIVDGYRSTLRAALFLENRVMSAADTTARVLIIDDDVDTRSTLQEVLEGAGYTVAAFASGEEGLSSLMAPGAHPDLILLDMEMPGMSGAEFARQAKSTDPLAKIPIVLVSGLPVNDPSIRKWLVATLLKPLDLDSLLETIEGHLPPHKRPPRGGDGGGAAQ